MACDVCFGRKHCLWVKNNFAAHFKDTDYRDSTENIIKLSNCKECGKMTYPQVMVRLIYYY